MARMSKQPDIRGAIKHLVLGVLLVAVAAWAFNSAYYLGQPFQWEDETTGLTVKLLNHPEGWEPVDTRHDLDVAPGEHVFSAEPIGGLVHITVHRLSCGQPVDPEEIVSEIDKERKAEWERYREFWHAAPNRGAWRMETSFGNLDGLKSIKRVSGGPGALPGPQIVYDYVIEDDDGCWWYVGAYLPQILMRYYEVDLKLHLAWLDFGVD